MMADALWRSGDKRLSFRVRAACPSGPRLIFPFLGLRLSGSVSEGSLRFRYFVRSLFPFFFFFLLLPFYPLLLSLFSFFLCSFPANHMGKAICMHVSFVEGKHIDHGGKCSASWNSDFA